MVRPGARVLIPYLHSYRDRHGKERFYYRRDGKRYALPAPDDPSFMERYAAAAAAHEAGQDIDKPRGAPGTFSRLISDYYRSTDFKRLKGSTAAVYRNMLDKFAQKHGHRRVDQMKREHVDLLIGSMSERPGAANSFLKRLKTLMGFALARGWIVADPTLRMKGYRSGEIHTWTDGEIAQFESHWPVGTKQRLAFALHLFTGQRRSDVCRMTWADYEGGFIRVVQEKTGAKLDVPAHPDLVAILDRAPRKHLAILTTEYGRAYSVAGYGNWINEAIRAAGLPDRCVAHGLRKAAARQLAEAGCTAHEIASITGHKTLGEVERYTRAANQRTLATRAIEKQSRNKQG
jgi:enterobacteria phage integrase